MRQRQVNNQEKKASQGYGYRGDPLAVWPRRVLRRTTEWIPDSKSRVSSHQCWRRRVGSRPPAMSAQHEADGASPK